MPSPSPATAPTPAPTLPPKHHYGPNCRLAPIDRPASDDDNPPLVRAQFFYCAPVPLDDPISAAAVSSPGAADRTRTRPRPFSIGDNHALERAWLSLSSADDARLHARGGPTADDAGPDVRPNLTRLVRGLAALHRAKHRGGPPSAPVALPAADPLAMTPQPVCCAALAADVSAEIELAFCVLVRTRRLDLSVDRVAQDVMMEYHMLAAGVARTSPDASSSPVRPLNAAAANRGRRSRSLSRLAPNAPVQLRSQIRTGSVVIPVRPPTLDDGLSGMPFLRVGSPDTISISLPPPRPSLRLTGHAGQFHPSQRRQQLPPPSSQPTAPPEDQTRTQASDSDSPSVTPSIPEAASIHSADASTNPGSDSEPEPEPKQKTESMSSKEEMPADGDHASDHAVSDPSLASAAVDVTVGVSRLHAVSLPALQMKPIYWSPLNDIVPVVRATWFYKDTMLPISVAVSNQLEAGYRKLRPFRDAWRDEIRAAVAAGPLDEEKVAHALWPEENDDSPTSTSTPSNDHYCASHCFGGAAACEGDSLVVPAPAPDASAVKTKPKLPYAGYVAVYKDLTSAFMIKPALQPSAYYDRRPVYRILKGLTVGIPVVRGFNRGAWEAANPPKGHDAAPAPAPAPVPAAAHPNPTGHDGDSPCDACEAERVRSQVSDLVLVIHGIGQKFAERVESFHFTHAVTAFRRAVLLELAQPAVRAVLRPGHNGIMVLPVNWRHNLSFDAAAAHSTGHGRADDDDNDDRPALAPFSLRDIEPDSIPAVRALISDVMFDIPFYLSRHKSRMVDATIAEANRVHRLWCRNNPAFARHGGRVHLVGHSLGSVIALEILSAHQPTHFSPPAAAASRLIQQPHFAFDTTNLFLLGSPAGFFLLLERGRLAPRCRRAKPGADPADPDIGGDRGTLGCLAVDNVYNIVAPADPIAYLLNGTVDLAYAASLQRAIVPPARPPSLLRSLGAAVRALVPAATAATAAAATVATTAAATAAPPTPGAQPMELAVHDFAREARADRAAFALNDNGQIDFHLRPAAGPLELQYVNMFGAHFSYWTNPDFVRMLCVEIGRRPGRAHALPAMRAVKAAGRRISPLPVR